MVNGKINDNKKGKTSDAHWNCSPATDPCQTPLTKPTLAVIPGN